MVDGYGVRKTKGELSWRRGDAPQPALDQNYQKWKSDTQAAFRRPDGDDGVGNEIEDRIQAQREKKENMKGRPSVLRSAFIYL